MLFGVIGWRIGLDVELCDGDVVWLNVEAVVF